MLVVRSNDYANTVMHNGSAFFHEPMVSRRCLLCVLFACMGIALRGAMQLLIVLPFAA